MKENYETKVIGNDTAEVASGPVKQKNRYSFPGENFSVEAESVDDAVKKLQEHKGAVNQEVKK